MQLFPKENSFIPTERKFKKGWETIASFLELDLVCSGSRPGKAPTHVRGPRRRGKGTIGAASTGEGTGALETEGADPQEIFYCRSTAI